ncbi:response regulator transcription factor [Cohnella hashimotonis]|uniref:Response regulator transcription factor n=1 Tax=Cohnella hashimotonis TaxID=2826895 RepID=A0ABT6TCQ1_9BACL|nr:response regulator transcription factor [Cohnella hashimotonis]MDI4644608.1 response regulator transcription factor [Cohnella hashimotonis]
MYKVVLVDDEPSIREGLAELLDWESLGYRIAGSAASGKEALGLNAQIRPELMIVDIRMPGMDGMELIRELKKEDAGVRVLVLSGYADFNYARQAIALGVDNYLLKPVDEDELADNLCAIKRALDEREAQREAEKRTKEERLSERLETMLSEAPASAETWAAEMASWGEADAGFRVVLIDIDADGGETALVRRQICERLKASYEKTGAGIVFGAGASIGLLLADSVLRDSARRRLTASLRDWGELAGCRVFAAAGEGVTDAAGIPLSFAAAKLRAQHRFFYDGADFIDDETARRLPSPEAVAFEPDLLQRQAERLYLAVCTGSEARVAPIVEEIGDLMLGAGEGEDSLKARFVQLLTRLLEKLSARQPGAGSAPTLLESKLLAIHRACGYQTMLAQISGLLVEAIRLTDDGGGERQIRKMTQLIDAHYKDNLKLEKLAEAFNYNSAYLGKLFKSVTGDSFNTYLDKVRIAKAKQLLQTGLKVYEAAEQVGYPNPDYFHGKFRKYEGLSPGAYRSQFESS